MAGVAPNEPPGHRVQVPMPATLYCPAGHVNCVVDVEPTAHAYPAVHAPLHADDVRPGVAPKAPAGHAVQVPTPPTLN